MFQSSGTKEPTILVKPHLVGQQVSLLIPFIAHSAKFHELEDFLLARLLADLAGTELGKEGIAPHGDGADNGQDQKDREEDDQGDEG